MVNEKEFLEILKRINGEMEYDPFCTKGESYMIYNLYFDNERDDIIKHSLSKP